MALMFVGRVGPLTITSLFLRKESRLKFLEEKILIG